MKRLALVLGAAASIYGCQRPHLVVNPSPTAEIVRKIERDAIADLQQLVETAEAEEAWVYLPQREEWHDVGLEAAETAGESITIDLDEDKTRQLANVHRHLILYHIHPQKPLSRLIQPHLDSLSEKGYSLQQVLDLLTYDGAMPSPTDLGSATFFLCSLQAEQAGNSVKYPSKIKYQYKIASHYGISECIFDQEELFDFCTLTPSEYILPDARILGKMIVDSVSLDKTQRMVKKAVAGQIAVSLFKNNFLKIEFTPYNLLR